MNSTEIILIALGGNALIRDGEKGTFEEQNHNIQVAIKAIVDIIEKGYKVVLTHGNGPQVGATLVRHKLAADIYPSLPLHACNAETQGLIGYMIEQALQDELNRRHFDKFAIALITRVLVDEKDQAFQNPTKPIGKIFFEKEMIDSAFGNTNNNTLQLVAMNDYPDGVGYRLVVPSPKPVSILEYKAIRTLIDAGFVVIACGGGGIPVMEKNRATIGIDAVIDKDLASERLATLTGASKLVLLTDVEGVYENYGTQTQSLISEIKVDELHNNLVSKKFGEGSMAPKLQASIDFINNGGKEAIIGHVSRLSDTLAGLSGTHIIP